MRKKAFIFISIILVLLISSKIYNKYKSPLKKDMKKQYENEYFIFYSEDKDLNALEDIEDILINNYDNIMEILDYTSKEKFKVFIYPDIGTYHSLMRGKPEDWMVGHSEASAFYMTSPNSPGKVHDYDGLIKVSLHEFIHCVTLSINSDIPNHYYLSEGIATYLANQNEYIPDTIKAYEGLEFPNYKKLRGSPGAYELSYIAIEYIVDEYGYDKIKDLIRNPSVVEVLGVSEKKFQREWVSFIRNTY